MKFKLSIFTIVLLLTAIHAFSQTFTVSGRVADQRDTTPVIGATIQLIPAGDSVVKNGAVSDVDGNFQVTNVAQGTYSLRVSYLGYAVAQRTVNVISGNVALGLIKMSPGKNVLGNVTVEGQQIRAQQIGDTTQFNANAYKTNPDASAEDLVTKMPGVTSDNSGVKVNGEAVQQILVDGKPFFGDDPAVALKNLPAEVIDKIQVFDKLSDQAQFTGFDDGQSQKAINIITKRGKNNGQFGKIYAGYGTDDHYSAGGNINFFNGDRRISIIGLSNDINQQNFSSEDLLGVSSGSSGGSGRGGYGGGGRGGGGFTGGGGSQGSGSSAGNFLVGQQNGITTTNSIGLNYSDNWGKKIKVTGSYFFNQTDNKNETDLLRNYFTGADSNLVYKENSSSESKNYNHRFNFRFEYNIDSSNSIIITPKLSFQDNRYTTYLMGNSTVDDGTFAGLTNNNTESHNAGYNFSNNLLYRHKFAKRGRTISLNITTQLNEKDGDGKSYNLKYADDTTLLDQEYNLYNNGYTISGNLTYTEPVGKKGQLMANYSPSYSKSKSDKETYNLAGSNYTDLDTLLSNKYDNKYVTQRGGLSYRLTDRKYNFMAGANLQYATLDGQQYFPYDFSLQKNFTSVLPQAMFNYRFNQGTNLRFMYRTSTNAPSITQLQNVVDVSNLLLLRTGNPDLKQDYEHTFIVRYGQTKAATARSLFVFLYGNFAQNYIANATYIPAQDSVVNGVVISRGSQLSRPVNLDGYYNTRAFVTYGLPVNFVKSNLNFNAGITYARTPALINNQENFSNNYALSGGLVLSSNVSENLDFTVSYNGNYNIAKNTLQTQSDNTYYSHVAALKLNYIFLKRFVINTSLNETMYSGLSQSFNQQFLLWNAYAGYKFLKDRSLEARISAYDILNQNKSISRTFTDTYIEDSQTKVLTQYFMFTLTYTLRNFKGGGTMPAAEPDRQRSGMPSGMPPGGGRFRDQ